MSEKCNDFLSAFHAYLSSQILRNLFSHLLYRIHNLPDLLSGNFIDMHATGADGHGTAGTTDFERFVLGITDRSSAFTFDIDPVMFTFFCTP